MRIWSISDLHLSFGVPNKSMGVFGEHWVNHFDKIEADWRSKVDPSDLVLIAGDISWAMHLKDALPDLEWIDRLPGTKVLSKGNHDLWWQSVNKVREALPPSIKVIHQDTLSFGNVAIGGARLWDHPRIEFGPFIEMREFKNVHVRKKEDSLQEHLHDEKIFKTELVRLETSLKKMKGAFKIAMVHYPPTGPDHTETEVTRLLEDYQINLCIYGHLHNLRPGAPVDFTLNGIRYICTAADWLDFKLVSLL